MKTHTTITELTHEDLVDLLCTATYGSSWLGCYAPDHEGLSITDTDCREDIWAKALLAGKNIVAVDHYAEGEVYSDKGLIDIKSDDDSAIYTLSLEDIKKGLEMALNGTFKTNDDSEVDWLHDCVSDLMSGDLDLVEADALMQIIMFGVLIYC